MQMTNTHRILTMKHERRQLDDPDVEGRVILKSDLTKIAWEGVD